MLSIQSLRVGYRKQSLLSVPLEMNIQPGDFWGIVGPNGSGKTTLLKTLLKLIPPVSGQIERKKNLRVGYVPQRTQIKEIFPISVTDLVSMGCLPASGVQIRFSKAQRHQVTTWIEKVGLSEHKHTLIRELSGGQRQRALVARALVNAPDLLILDEPTDGLDLLAESDLFSLIEELQQSRKLCVILVSHRLSLVAARAKQILLFEKGNWVSGSTSTLLTPKKLQEIYGTPIQKANLKDTPVFYVEGIGPL